MMTGQIKEGRGGLYTVRDDAGEEHVLRAKKKFRRDGMVPLPGDRVHFSPRPGEEHGWLEELLPRSSLCLRPPVANIQRIVIVVAQEPPADWLLVDKLLLHAHTQGITPLLAINKCDMGEDTWRLATTMYAGAGVTLLRVSAATGEGLGEMENALRGELSCLAGQSGVGKSALLTRLMGVELESGEISRRISRGKQTTRHTTLLYRDGLQVLDTPGFSLLEMPQGLSAEDIQVHYPEFLPHLGTCRFKPCQHVHEPGCRVKEAVVQQMINPQRYERYAVLFQQALTTWKERYD